MKFAARLAVLVLAAGGLWLARDRLRRLAGAVRLACLLAVTFLTLSIAWRFLEGEEPLYTGLATGLLAPSVVLAWRDLARSGSGGAARNQPGR